MWYSTFLENEGDVFCLQLIRNMVVPCEQTRKYVDLESLIFKNDFTKTSEKKYFKQLLL